MNIFHDEDGLDFSASSESSVRQYRVLVEAFMGYRPQTGGELKCLLEADPQMPMALCMKGYFGKMMGGVKNAERARILLGALQPLKTGQALTCREAWHTDALEAWCLGRLDDAALIWEKILVHYPRDCVALRLVYFNHFYSGNSRRMRDTVARVMSRWEDDHPLYGYLLGMYSFALEECGDLDQAEKIGRRAVEINPEDSWSVHAVAHVLETRQQHEAGIGWLKGLEADWSTVNNFRFHLYWHQCLYHLERGEFGIILDIYDRLLVSDLGSEFYLDVCNAASLLWRLELYGVDVGERWHTLLDVSRGHVQDRDLVFVSLHYLMPLAAAGTHDDVRALVANLEDWENAEETQSTVLRSVGMDVAHAVCLMREGEYDRAYRRLSSARYRTDLIGGSHAQRDLFALLMLDCARRGGHGLEAEGLLAERVALRPHSGWNWLQYSGALQENGRREAAENATRQAELLTCALNPS